MEKEWICPRCETYNELDDYLFDGDISIDRCKSCRCQVEITCHKYTEYDAVEVQDD